MASERFRKEQKSGPTSGMGPAAWRSQMARVELGRNREQNDIVGMGSGNIDHRRYVCPAYVVVRFDVHSCLRTKLQPIPERTI
jgi:hypothetical protein